MRGPSIIGQVLSQGREQTPVQMAARPGRDVLTCGENFPLPLTIGGYELAIDEPNEKFTLTLLHEDGTRTIHVGVLDYRRHQALAAEKQERTA